MSNGDIKPQNILVAGDQAKLTDFGCSVLPNDMYVRSRENGGTILYSAPEVVGSTLKIDGNLPDLLLKKASLLGLQANYSEAAKILLSLNRELPNRPAILKRLVLVFEQTRDIGKASAGIARVY